MKKLSPLFLIVVLIVAGCQSSQNAVNTAIAQTQAVLPTNTTVPINTTVPTLSIEEIVIDPNIFQPEDLGLVAGKLTNELPKIGPFNNFEAGVVQLSRELLTPNKKYYSGWVSIIFYESSEKSQRPLENIRAQLKSLLITGVDKEIGDDSVLYQVDSNYYFSGIAFCHDNYFVSVYINDNSEVNNFDLGALAYYAESIDLRIQKMIGK